MEGKIYIRDVRRYQITPSDVWTEYIHPSVTLAVDRCACSVGHSLLSGSSTSSAFSCQADGKVLIAKHGKELHNAYSLMLHAGIFAGWYKQRRSIFIDTGAYQSP